MPKGIRKCKVCGIEYPYCKTNLQVAFRWQDVACCPEHAAIYFERIAESRGQAVAQPDTKPTATSVAEDHEEAVEPIVVPKKTKRKRSKANE